MFYLFILESIGTSELMLIGLVALIIFGPRKLPEMMKTIGKAVAEFKNSTNDFKQSWEKEVEFEKNELNSFGSDDIKTAEFNQTIEKNSVTKMDEMILPEIREVRDDEIERNFVNVKPQDEEDKANISIPLETARTNKTDWL